MHENPCLIPIWGCPRKSLCVFLEMQNAAFHQGLHCLQSSGTEMHHFMGLVQENLSSWIANNTGPDQPAHPRSLISAFVVQFLESFLCKLAMGVISIF